MRYLSLGEVADLHQALLEQTGGTTGIRDLGMLESALVQPRATFDGQDLHDTVIAKEVRPRLRQATTVRRVAKPHSGRQITESQRL